MRRLNEDIRGMSDAVPECVVASWQRQKNVLYGHIQPLIVVRSIKHSHWYQHLPRYDLIRGGSNFERGGGGGGGTNNEK